jgi:hypothetical protein
MSVTFTDEQKRLVNTYYPGLGSIPPSVGSGGLLTIIADAVDAAIDAAIVAGPDVDLAAHLADTAGAHNDTAIAYTRVDGSKKNIAAGSDDVGTAINNLDDATGLLSGLTTADKSTIVAALNEVDAAAAAAQADVDLVTSGWVTILNGQTSVVQAVGAGFNAKPVQLTFGEQPTAAGVKWLSGVVAGGNLTVSINVDNTANLLVYYTIDGR